jgi:hypothetical protein
MANFVKTKQKRNDRYAAYNEKQYVENNLNYFINKNKKSTRTIPNYGWVINEDHDTLLRNELLRFTIDNFNLYELYVVFFNPSITSFFSSNMYDTRRAVIDNITRDDSFTPEEAKRLKRKIWDMHPIFFGLMTEFINNSELFWDKDKMQIVYPRYQTVYR